MSKEEAIKILNGFVKHFNHLIDDNITIGLDKETAQDDIKAFTMAIEALNQQRCEEAISREYLFKVLDDFCGHDRTATITLDALADLVYDMPSVKQQEPKWIPVSELPKTDGEYLLFGKIVEDEDNNIFIGNYDSCAEKFGWWEDYYDTHTLGFLDSEIQEYASVIAWMPLPKPYMKGGD